MQAEELLERELAFQSKTNLRKILAAKDVTPEELERIRSVVGVLEPGQWAIEDSVYNIAGIRRRARVCASRMHRAGLKIGVVIIDYLQLAGDNGEGREQSVAAISRGCKLLAKELGCTVLAISQLNRMCELRDDKRPFMSDLRESGSIEQDADIVAFVYREHIYDNSFPAEEAEVIIRKHRSGPTGTIHLKYNPQLVCFLDRETSHEGPIQPSD
jgi:replicative DNA helicase